jgi:hypothetical protein
MSRVATLLVLLCALQTMPGCTLWNEKKVAEHWSDVTGGESLERSLWRDIKAHNGQELAKHMAGNYVAVTPAGKLDRQAALAQMQQLDLQDYSLGDFQVELNASTLVVTYTVVLHGTFGGQALPASPTRIMAVWQHEKAGWMAIAHSVQS